MKTEFLSFVAVCVILAVLLSPTPSGLLPAAAQAPSAMAAAVFDPSSLVFVENAGQFASGARFQVRWRDLTLWLAEDAIWVVVADPGADTSSDTSQSPASAANVRLSFPGSNHHSRLEPFHPLETRVSFFTGGDAATWRANVPAWGGVRYAELYPGIDLELTGERGALVPRLVVRQGADLSAVRLRVEGARSVTLAGTSLSLSTAAGKATWPLLRLEEAGEKTPSVVEMDEAFDVAAPFVVEDLPMSDTLAPGGDPTHLIYSTFLGGSGDDRVHDIAVDTSGAVYVTGYTWSFDFPTTPGAFDTEYSGGYADAFVVKVNVAGSSLEYATFLGGSRGARGYGIAVDGSGAAYITGDTWSFDFPTTPGAFDTTFNGGSLCSDAFVVKLNATGSALEYATFLGGGDRERGEDLVVDNGGAVSVAGYTLSADFPTSPGAFDTTFNGGDDAFVTKLNAFGSALDYSTFLGGSGNEQIAAIDLHGTGTACVTGSTWSYDFPTTPDAFDTSFNGGDNDAFVVKLDALGSYLEYATFVGGGGQDEGNGISVDASGAAYITGATWSPDFPVTPGAFDTTFNDCLACSEAFVVKLLATGAGLEYATYLGGSDRDQGGNIALDEGGISYIAGDTASSDFPTTPGAYDTDYNGGNHDAFMVKLNAAGSALGYGTFLGGAGDEWDGGIALDDSAAICVTGQTWASDYPTTPGAFDTGYNGSGDGFITKLAIEGRTTYYITGRVTNPNGEGIPGVIISAGVGGSAVTDTSGNYAIGELVTGTWTLTPTLEGYNFDPITRTVELPPDAIGQDFVGTFLSYSIGGQVLDAGANPVSSVTIYATGGYSATTSATGAYALTGLLPGSYTLTPGLEGYRFDPATRTVEVPPDAADQDFVATLLTYSIGGQVVDARARPLSGVIIYATGGYSVTTAATGKYILTGLLPGKYTLTPAMEGCTFYPATRTVYLPPDATYQDFRGELLQHRVYLPLVVRNP